MASLEILATGFTICEGPRWHEGRLWFSDLFGNEVKSVDLTGDLRTEAEMPGPWSRTGRLGVRAQRRETRVCGCPDAI